MDFYTRSKQFSVDIPLACLHVYGLRKLRYLGFFLYEQNLHAHMHLACTTWEKKEKKGISFIYRTPPPPMTACKGHICMSLGHMLV
jgi:hypothetical protein